MRFFLIRTLSAVMATPAIAAEEKPGDPNKQMCRRFESDVGSIMFHSICHTAAEWKDIDNRNANATSTAINRLPGNSATRQNN